MKSLKSELLFLSSEKQIKVLKKIISFFFPAKENFLTV